MAVSIFFTLHKIKELWTYMIKNYPDEKKIAITFDDGPHPRKTEKILNILDQL